MWVAGILLQEGRAVNYERGEMCVVGGTPIGHTARAKKDWDNAQYWPVSECYESWF